MSVYYSPDSPCRNCEKIAIDLSKRTLPDAWPPVLPADENSWQPVVDLQLQPWIQRGSLDVARLLRDTAAMRRPPAAGPVSNPVAALVDTKNWHVTSVGAKWVGHHTVRLRAVLDVFRMAQRKFRDTSRPLPDIQFVLVLSDGHGLHPRQDLGRAGVGVRLRGRDGKIDLD